MAFSELLKKYAMFGLALVLALTILLLDLSFPLGVAGGVPYVAAIMLGLWFPDRRQVLFITLVAPPEGDRK